MSLLVAAILFGSLVPGLSQDQTYTLRDSKSSYVLSQSSYPRNDFELEVRVTCTAPGRVLDTVGIDAAPTGSWSLSVGTDGVVVFMLWDGSKWTSLASRRRLKFGVEAAVTVKRVGAAITLSMDGQAEGELRNATPLSGRRVFVGDYKGDERFGAGHTIYLSMVGTVRVSYFGAPRGSSGDSTGKGGFVYSPGRKMVFLQPESQLYMSATFDKGSVTADCATATGAAPRSWSGSLNTDNSGTAAFKGGKGGEIFYRFDPVGRSVTTFWKPIGGPPKMMIWVRVAAIGSRKPATADEIDLMNGGGK